MNFIYKHIKYIFISGIITFFLISNHGCQTMDDLQSDYLLQRSTIDSLNARVSLLTEELIKQNAITSSLVEDVSQLNEEVAENTEAASINSELLQVAINDVNVVSGAVTDIEDNLENISYYIGDLIEESGDLSGDLNNLLNQVTRIDLITSDLSSAINNLDLDFEDYNDLEDLADLIADLVIAQNEIDQIQEQLDDVQLDVVRIGESGGSSSEQTNAVIGEWVLSSDTSRNSCSVTSIIFSIEENDALTFRLYTENEDPIDGKFIISFERSPFLIEEGTISLTVSTTVIGTITNIDLSDSGTILSAKFDLDEYCVGQMDITYTSDVDLEDNNDTTDDDTTDDDTTDDDTEDNTEIIICSDCPQKISGYDIFIAGTSETEGAVYWVNGQKKRIKCKFFCK